MKKKARRFAKTRQPVSSLQTSKLQSLITSTSRKLYLDCNKLTVDIYQDCLFDNELQGLIIEGTATQEELQELWDKIYLESLNISQGDTYNEIFELTKEINDLNGKLMIVQCSIDHLQIQWSQSICDILNALHLKCDIKPQHTGSTLIQKLNAIIGRAKKWSITVQQKRNDIERLRTKATEQEGMTRKWFDDCLDNLTQFYRCPLIQPHEISVSRFFSGLNKLDDYVKKQELLKHK